MRRWVIEIVFLGLGALFFTGCGSSSVSRSQHGSSEMGPMPMAGMTGMSGGDTTTETDDAGDPPPDIEAILAANAEALREMESLPIDRRQPRSPGERESETMTAQEMVAAAIVEEPASVVSPPESTVAASPSLTRRERISEATEELAMLLRAEADLSDAPVSSMAALAALELIERGVAPNPADMKWLTARERELLSAFYDLFSEAGERLESDPNDLLSVHDVIEGLPGRLQSWKRLSIPVAALCVRVDGFGQYEEFGSNTFVAGRAHRMIVYTELADFRSEAAMGPGGESGRRVRLTQDLSLYHDADGLLAWREANQKIDEFSRNERRDFFLVQLIELPRTLTVGRYRLKVTLVDEVAGSTAEAVIPIDVVADAGLVGG